MAMSKKQSSTRLHTLSPGSQKRRALIRRTTDVLSSGFEAQKAIVLVGCVAVLLMLGLGSLALIQGFGANASTTIDVTGMVKVYTGSGYVTYACRNGDTSVYGVVKATSTAQRGAQLSANYVSVKSLTDYTAIEKTGITSATTPYVIGNAVSFSLSGLSGDAVLRIFVNTIQGTSIDSAYSTPLKLSDLKTCH